MNDKKVVLVSGGSRGLGQAFVELYLSKGWVVGTFSRTETEFVKRSREQHSKTFFYQSLEAGDIVQLRRFVEELQQVCGSLDILINNAAEAWDGPFAIIPDEKIDSLVNTNLASVLHLTKLCVRAMMAQGRGKIINISSVTGLGGYSGLSVYSATKWGIIGMTRSLARELGPKNITVNAVAPGYLETEMSRELSQDQLQQMIRRTPLGRLAKFEDVMAAVDFLSSERANYITGQVLAVDGGFGC